jgi:hypothetical protein
MAIAALTCESAPVTATPSAAARAKLDVISVTNTALKTDHTFFILPPFQRVGPNLFFLYLSTIALRFDIV